MLSSHRSKILLVFFLTLTILQCHAERIPPILLKKKAAEHPLEELIKSPADNYRMILSLHVQSPFAPLPQVAKTLAEALTTAESQADKAALTYLLTECGNARAVKRARNLRDTSGLPGMTQETVEGLLSAWRILADDSTHDDLRQTLTRSLNDRLARDVAALPESLKQEVASQYLHAPEDPLKGESLAKTAAIYRNFGMTAELEKRLVLPDDTMKYPELLDTMQAYHVLGNAEKSGLCAETLWKHYPERLTAEDNSFALEKVLNCLPEQGIKNLGRLEPLLSQKPWLCLTAIRLLQSSAKEEREKEAARYADIYIDYAGKAKYQENRLLSAQEALAECGAHEAELRIIDAMLAVKSDIAARNEITYLLKRADCLRNLGRKEECIAAYEHALKRALESDGRLESTIRRRMEDAKKGE